MAIVSPENAKFFIHKVPWFTLLFTVDEQNKNKFGVSIVVRV